MAPFKTILDNADVYLGKTLVLGGYVLETEKANTGTVLTVLQAPLGIGDKPKSKDKSEHKETQKEDIHSLGFHYEPDYDWEIKETDEAKDINNFPCRLFLAEGDADFSEIKLKFWVSTDSQFPGAAELHDFMLEQLERDIDQEPILETLKKYENSFPVHHELIVERAIARTLHYETNLTTLEMAEAPEGIYDLPPDLKKRAK